VSTHGDTVFQAEENVAMKEYVVRKNKQTNTLKPYLWKINAGKWPN